MRIGTDIADVEEIGKLAAKERFLALVFTPQELTGANARHGRRRTEYLAGRFAGKEAVVKVLGTGFSKGAWWRDIEIVGDPQGAPMVRLHRRAATIAREMGAQDIEISISHKGPWALAVAICDAHGRTVRHPATIGLS